MPVPTSINDLSVTASSNSPAGGDSVGSSLDDFLRAIQAILKESGGTLYTASAADTITFNTTPTFASYATGQRFTIKAYGANTGAVTLNINGIGAKNVYKKGSTALAAGDIPAAGAVFVVVYDGTQFQLLDVYVNTSGFVSTGAITGSGLTMATAKLLGRTTASTGAIEEIAVSGATLSGGTLTISSGKLVQYVNSSSAAVATGTTTIPYDDTTPQNTEGDQYLSVSITPTNASNKLLIIVNAVVAHSAAGGRLIKALFQDSTANALNAVVQGYDSANKPETIPLIHYMTAGTTSATTFKVRIGSDQAGTTTFNGSSSARLMGGVMGSSITIMELA